VGRGSSARRRSFNGFRRVADAALTLPGVELETNTAVVAGIAEEAALCGQSRFQALLGLRLTNVLSMQR
jgi:hypothetical protein